MAAPMGDSCSPETRTVDDPAPPVRGGGLDHRPLTGFERLPPDHAGQGVQQQSLAVLDDLGRQRVDLRLGHHDPSRCDSSGASMSFMLYPLLFAVCMSMARACISSRESVALTELTGLRRHRAVMRCATRRRRGVEQLAQARGQHAEVHPQHERAGLVLVDVGQDRSHHPLAVALGRRCDLAPRLGDLGRQDRTLPSRQPDPRPRGRARPRRRRRRWHRCCPDRRPTR